MEHAYYVRYGLTGRVGRFLAATGGMERGQSVVVRTHRGTELGEVLVSRPPQPASETSVPSPGTARVLRPATQEDLAAAQRAERDRQRRFGICEAVFHEGVWPFDVIDVEPLLDDGRTVVHYLGPHDLDVSGLLATFRALHGLDVVFEAAGRDAAEDASPQTDDAESAAGCGHCGSDGDGCGTGGCGTREHSGGGGCAGCAVMKWSARRAGAGPDRDLSASAPRL